MYEKVVASGVRKNALELSQKTQIRSIHLGEQLGRIIRIVDVPFELVDEVHRSDGDINLISDAKRESAHRPPPDPSPIAQRRQRGADLYQNR